MPRFIFITRYNFSIGDNMNKVFIIDGTINRKPVRMVTDSQREAIDYANTAWPGTTDFQAGDYRKSNRSNGYGDTLTITCLSQSEYYRKL